MGPDRFPALRAPLTATARDLPPRVAAAMRAPNDGERRLWQADGLEWSGLAWGHPHDAPLLLLHGVTSSAASWWRVGPALAAAGFQVVAPDMPGHGETRRWTGRTAFAATAAEVARLADVAGIDSPELHVIGHSWGAMVAAALPSTGLAMRVLVLLDPPAMTRDEIAARVPATDAPPRDLATAARMARAENPGWAERDLEAKAEALLAFDRVAVRGILRDNAWDGGLSSLEDAGAGIERWLVRGEQAAGSFLPDDHLPPIVARLGAEHVLTIADGSHSPHRTHPEATVLALLRAVGRA